MGSAVAQEEVLAEDVAVAEVEAPFQARAAPTSFAVGWCFSQVDSPYSPRIKAIAALVHLTLRWFRNLMFVSSGFDAAILGE